MNIMIVGVGGQGTLLASRIIGAVAMDAGYDLKLSEVHGMSQRGGSVVTYVKYGEKVLSPIIEKGEADVILAFEKLEAYRYISYLKKGGKCIVNTQKINPMPVIIGAAEYPTELFSEMEQKGVDLIKLDALSLAKEAGNIKAVNVVLIGKLAKTSSIAKEAWIKAIEKTVPQKFLEVNIKAFELGYEN